MKRKINVTKTIALIMALGMLCTFIPCGVATHAEAPEGVFTDVSRDDWFYSDVEYVNENGLMKGVAEETFAPDAPLSRAMCATILYRMAGEPDVSDVPTIFHDLWPKRWYFNAVKWARSENIVFGKDDGKFHPDDTATRAEMAVMIYRYCYFMDLTLKREYEYTGFSDEKNIPNYAKEAVIFLYETGLINGKSNNNFAPDDTVTRAETAAIIHRLIDNIVYPEEEPEPPMEIDPDDIVAKYGLTMKVEGLTSGNIGEPIPVFRVILTSDDGSYDDLPEISVSAKLSYGDNSVEVDLKKDNKDDVLSFAAPPLELRELDLGKSGTVICEVTVNIGEACKTYVVEEYFENNEYW